MHVRLDTVASTPFANAVAIAVVIGLAVPAQAAAPAEAPTDRPAEAPVAASAEAPAAVPKKASTDAPTEAPADTRDAAPAATPGAAPAAAREWGRFRGPNGTGCSNAEGIPSAWKEGEWLWRVELPGEGCSQPVLWGERIFLTSAATDGAERLVLCLRARDGSTEWTSRRTLEPIRKNPRNSHASSTPAVDGERVYAAFASSASLLLLALDLEGREVWARDLGPFRAQHGFGTSPIVHEDLVILANEHDGPSFVVALDRRTGEVRWKTERRTLEAAYGTPCVLEEPDGRAAILLLSHAHGLAALDARTGAPLWEAPVFDKRTVSSPVAVTGGLAIGTCGSGGGGNYLVAVRPGRGGGGPAVVRGAMAAAPATAPAAATGPEAQTGSAAGAGIASNAGAARAREAGADPVVGDAHTAYKIVQAAPYVPTPVARGALVFLWQEKGIITCIEAASGRVVWQERVEGSFYGSPVCVRDRLLCMTEGGEVVVVAAGRDFRLISRNPLGEGSRSTPAVAEGRLYLRTYRHLIAVGACAEEAAGDR